MLNKDHYQALAVVSLCITLALGVQVVTSLDHVKDVEEELRACEEESALDRIFDKLNKEP